MKQHFKDENREIFMNSVFAFSNTFVNDLAGWYNTHNTFINSCQCGIASVDAMRSDARYHLKGHQINKNYQSDDDDTNIS